MDYLTMRLLFPRAAVLGLLDETAFQHSLSLTAQRDVKPYADVYLTVFVVEVEPVPECGLRLRPVSTTGVGITTSASKRLIGRGFVWADTRPDSPSMDLLRAHFLGEEAFLRKTVMDLGYQLPVWRNHYRNCAGDLDSVPEILIEDPGAKDMERLFGSDLEK
jgi:hypothetical protein